MKKKLIQIFYDMRTQPVIAAVTVIGTALSIFLIMTVMMMQSVRIISMAPETHRDRMLYGKYFHVVSTDPEKGGDSSGAMSYYTAKRLYEGLDGVEEMSYFCGVNSVDVKGTNNNKFTGDVRPTDDGFFRVFDFTLLSGRYYTPEEVDAKSKVALVSRSTARRLFGSEDAVGQHFELDHKPFVVIGVVEDVSKLASMAYGEIFAPVDKDDKWGDELGPFYTALLVREGVDEDHIRTQIKKRYAEYDTELAPNQKKSVYHGAPYNQEVMADDESLYSNMTPDPTGSRVQRAVIYAILLLVPAINLSTMLHSRLRRRVSELGVRRAFGCTRSRIMGDIITENLIVTVAGGIIGLAAGILFAMFYDGLYTSSDGQAVRPALSLLLNWRILATAFGACFILNIISASVPAWMASRLNPVEAINAK